LSLCDADGTEIQQSEPVTTDRKTQVWRFELSRFRDTIRATRSPQLYFALTVAELTPQPLPILELTTTLDVTELHIDGLLHQNIWQLTTEWHETIPVRRRRIRFWSLWCPWQTPIERAIPDEAEDRVRLTIGSGELPIGEYRVEVVTADEWQPAAPQRPAAKSPNTIETVLGTPAEQLKHLLELPYDFQGYTERLLAAHDTENRRQWMRELASVFGRRDLPQALDVLNALNTHTDVVAALMAHQETELRSLAEMLMKWPIELCQELARRSPSLSSKDQTHWRRLIIALGLLDMPRESLPAASLNARELEALWSFWPPLALTQESVHLMRGRSSAIARARPYLGEQWLIAANESEQSAAPLPITIQSDWFGHAPGLEIDRTASQLYAIKEILALVPQGYLDEDSWPEVNLEWLMALREKPEQVKEVEEWLNNRGQVITEILDRLTTQASDVIDLLNHRSPRQPRPLLRMLPLMVGGIALAQRAIAYHPDGWNHPERVNLRRLALHALEIAEQLYTRDLCVFELALAESELRQNEHIPASSQNH
jgi:hypothetical protein